jgi:hypothetical protein
MFLFIATKLPVLQCTYDNSKHAEHSSSYVCLCSIRILAPAYESQAHSTDSRFLLSFMSARIAKFLVNLLRLPAVNHPQTETILSTYTWIFDLKLQYFLLIYNPPFFWKLYGSSENSYSCSAVKHKVTIQITTSFTEPIPAVLEALAIFNVTVIKGL